MFSLNAWIRRTYPRHPYLFEHSSVFMVGVIAAIAGLVMLVDPLLTEGSALRDHFPPIVVGIWLSLYLLGGVLLACSIYFRRVDLEVASCALVGWVLIIDAFAIYAERGTGGVLVSSFVFSLAIGLGVRGIVLAAIYPERRKHDVKPPPARRRVADWPA